MEINTQKMNSLLLLTVIQMNWLLISLNEDNSVSDTSFSASDDIVDWWELKPNKNLSFKKYYND